MKKAPWSRNDKIGLTSLAVAIVACIAAFVIPEGRLLVGLDEPVSVQAPTQSMPVSPSQAVPEPAPTLPKSQTPQRATSKVKGNKVTAPNGPAVTQGPGSAFSMNQTGGITAGTVNIGSFPPKPLILTDAQSSLVLSDMKPHRGESMEVALVNKTAATAQFGSRIVAMLEAAGWKVTYSSYGVLLRSNNTPPPPGLSFEVGEAAKSVANEFGLSLMRRGVIDERPLPAILAHEPKTFVLYICEPN